MKKIFLPVLMLLLVMNNALAGDVVVIGHDNLGKLDAATVQKIFTGKQIKVDGIDVTAVNVKSGPLRDQFLQTYLRPMRNIPRIGPYACLSGKGLLLPSCPARLRSSNSSSPRRGQSAMWMKAIWLIRCAYLRANCLFDRCCFSCAN